MRGYVLVVGVRMMSEYDRIELRDRVNLRDFYRVQCIFERNKARQHPELSVECWSKIRMYQDAISEIDLEIIMEKHRGEKVIP